MSQKLRKTQRSIERRMLGITKRDRKKNKKPHKNSDENFVSEANLRHATYDSIH